MLGPLAVRIGVKSLAAADEIRGRLFTAALPRRTNSTARSSPSARAASTKACASPRRDEGGVGERISSESENIPMPGKKASVESRREDIMGAAYDVAARQGLEALTLRSVAARADVSHGTVVFHFKRKRELVTSLVDRVLYATAVLRIPDAVAQITRPSERMDALLRSEMDRLSTEPRHFRLLLDYWTIGLRNAAIRQKVRSALEQYRDGFVGIARGILGDEVPPTRRRGSLGPSGPPVTAAGLAAVAVSLIHGCALQAVVDPKGFDVEQHFHAAAQMLERLANDRVVTSTAQAGD